MDTDRRDSREIGKIYRLIMRGNRERFDGMRKEEKCGMLMYSLASAPGQLGRDIKTAQSG